MFDMSLLFQAQDDYLDSFGNPKTMGKPSSDIAQNKCSWLVVKAYELGNEEQKQILKDNYGLGKESTATNEKRVKDVYIQLKVDEEYKTFEESTYQSILTKIANLSDKLPTSIFSETAEVIYHRIK